MTDIGNGEMISKYLSGTAYINIGEQDYQSILADGKISRNEILDMELMYDGNVITVEDLLEYKEDAGDTINIQMLLNDAVNDTSLDLSGNIEIADMSDDGAAASASLSGATQESIYNQLISDMIWDSLAEQLEEIASQSIDESSFDRSQEY